MIYTSNDNLEIYNEDMEELFKIDNLLKNLNLRDKKETENTIHTVLDISSKIRHFAVAEQLFGMAIGFKNSYVRSKLIDFVKSWLPYPSAIETIIRLTHDPDDLVSFKAMSICGEEKIELSVKYLSDIVGDITERNTPRKPVGLGAQIVIHNLLKIYGAKNEEELSYKKAYFEKHLKFMNHYENKVDISAVIKDEFKSLNEENMIYIEEGFFNYGISENDIKEKDFAWTDNAPSTKVWLPAYYIDKYPVTNEEYDEFCEFVEKYGHIFCHPNEPKNKNHRRNTYYDSKYKPDHPVSGIDFYDAYAYARWKGKTLPSEFQWEKAAKGNSVTKWPWGNDFDGSKVRYSGTLFEKKPDSISEWHDRLIDVYYNQDIELSESISIERNVSSYGVHNMLGGNWEWTKSDYFSKRMFHPSYNHNHDKLNQFGVLKGGSFYSHQELMYPAFRGKDIPYCRHDEMGFRCVKEIPLPLLRKENKKPIENKAIY
ncbi:MULTISPECIES: formylglycine-generating enzyme family protein [Mammaliicoccus]|uniref:SUMF1/EgtB/PvdO family nonheme iron enzyme n=7 Tax=Staphylococcaceae TaxID=90964 RepID=A0AB37HTU1_MAMSC|nr:MULTISPECIES: formylglycine-generating enzyme family protein [Mammaliicoccus]MCE5039730.1 SUMF1/EgtB/PvdO family nonheme iron enzyme [Mammaliicoccus sciuri]MCE5058288.1 SUMF1/EgtB/PvdO family nonheme iron enzyme [Mammaliicoccus sciuri]MDT0710933.1 formylglycine-generating enzyme family protein [Mammaliicoccus sciuri]MEB5649411.1 SUMF1/EgtB/PvdO family nonheme iron enzyme [Mammaliicoccus sciuri]MEB6255681.1 SUMF1/EgtB/PvdO family nonheme iron enzyme [Mammaliicoccus sciuri]